MKRLGIHSFLTFFGGTLSIEFKLHSIQAFV